MKRIVILALMVSMLPVEATAQSDLFNTEKLPPRHGFVLSANGNLDFPAVDMADRFGTSYRVGIAVHYKTKTNWMFGPKFDFILGSQIREDSLMSNMKDKNGELINQDGQRLSVQQYERGYLVGLQAGRILNISKSNSDDGILLMTSAGFIQHKINLYDKQKTIPQIRGDYRKGYDRLTNGWFLEQYAGYTHFSKSGAINFHIGLDIMAGFTQGRRDYQFDIMRPDNDSRVDILFGIRGGWYIPFFKRKSEEYFFE